MADFKITYIFEGPAKGWTESYILRGANDDHSKQVPLVEKLAKARANLLAEPCFIKGYRISVESTGPDALLSYTKFLPGKVDVPGSGVIKLIKAADPDQALLVRCSNAAQNRHRHIYLRGVPDAIEMNFGEYNHDEAWDGLLTRFFNVLTTGVWGWMSVNTALSFKKIQVGGVVENADGTTTFTFATDIFPIGLANGSLVKIRVSGINKKSPANGVHIVRVINRSTATTENALASGKYHFGGKGSYTPLAFVAIENAEAQKIVTRETGAPLLQSRGRQPARARG